jgi:hypothetical protein
VKVHSKNKLGDFWVHNIKTRSVLNRFQYGCEELIIAPRTSRKENKQWSWFKFEQDLLRLGSKTAQKLHILFIVEKNGEICQKGKELMLNLQKLDFES